MVGADVRRLGEKVGHLARIDAFLPLDTRVEKTPPLAVELAVQSRNELHGFRREHALLTELVVTFDFDAFVHDKLINR
jgi:hypothetical protein